MSYLDNGTIRLGVDLSLGGAITELSPSGQDKNVVNSYDWGRQVQMSFYSGPVPFTVGDKKPAKHWEHLGWNPVQAGDDYGNGSKVVEHRNDGRSLRVKCIPMQWPLDDVPGECTFECWITLDGPAARVRCRLENQRSDKTQYPARWQEQPAVYTNAPYSRLMSYTGAEPFTGAAARRLDRGKGGTFPWISWLATESWAALVDDDGWGLGVWEPGTFQFSGGFSGEPGQGGPRDAPTGYMTPVRVEVLDHNIQHEYEYTLILGRLDEIRGYIDRHARPLSPPSFRFDGDRQGWHLVNAHDDGWPLHGEWVVHLEKDDPQLIGPAGFWKASDAPRLIVRAAFQTRQANPRAQLFWSTHAEPGFAEARRVSFPIVADGQEHTYEVDLASSPGYRGAITGLRFDPVGSGAKGDWGRIRSISLNPSKS